MAIKVTNTGENLLLNWALKQNDAPDLELHLFSNDYTPVDDSDSGDFTECTFIGYSSKPLARSGWDDSTSNGSDKGEIVFGTAQTWDATSEQTVYGYYITTDDTNGDVVWAERFDNSRDLGEGISLTITPLLTGDSDN